MLTRAYSLLEIKSVDDDLRIIEGIASTPELDRQGDSMDPAGAKFSLPMPLLFQHQADQPIGHVIEAKVTAKGIRIKAKIAAKGIDAVIDRAWNLIKAKLVRGLSIDWLPLAPPTIKDGAYRYSSWEWVGLSTVTIPANQSASIQLIKSLDTGRPAASGTAARVASHPGVSGLSVKDRTMETQNYSEQIAAERAVLLTKQTRIGELMADEATEAGLNADDQAELETLTKEIGPLTSKVDRLLALEAAQASLGKTVISMPAARRETPSVKTVELPKGTIFTRVAMAVAAGRGSMSDTLQYAKRFTNTPEVYKYIQAGLHQKAEPGVAVLDSPSWGSQLVSPNTVNTEFVELLMPRTIIGRVDGFDVVPFNIPIIEQTGGSTFAWVGEAAPKPVGELAFERTTMPTSKVAGIIVLSDELVRLSVPSAEAKAREDMIKQCAKFLDEQFIRVAVSAGASNPASITNGVASPAATGTTAAALRHDLNIALANFDGTEDDSPLVIVMTPALARGISLLTTSLGVAEFPGMTPQGGTLLGYRVIVSSSVDSGTIVIFRPSFIFLADDGRVTLDASREATLDMSGSTTATFSLWQNNCVGLRAERWIRWQKKRDSGVVAIIDTAAYAPA